MPERITRTDGITQTYHTKRKHKPAKSPLILPDLLDSNIPMPDEYGRYHGQADVTWNETELLKIVRYKKPKGVERAISRYVDKLPESFLIYLKTKGLSYTIPEIKTLLYGEHVVGHTAGEKAMIDNLISVSQKIINISRAEPAKISENLSNDLFTSITPTLDITFKSMRAGHNKKYGPRVSLGTGLEYVAHPRKGIREIFDNGISKIENIENVILRSATWAAFATYHQFYLDGNKRNSRNTMNTILLSHGYDSILIPESSHNQYTDVCVESFTTADLTSQISFFLNLYQD